MVREDVTLLGPPIAGWVALESGHRGLALGLFAVAGAIHIGRALGRRRP